MERFAAGRASGAKLFFVQTDKCVIIINPYRIGLGPGYQRSPQVSHRRASVKIMLLLNKVKIRAEREEEGECKSSKKAWKGRCSFTRVSTLNMGTLTGKRRELADMRERRNADKLCVTQTKWKGSKARNIGGRCKIFYNGADGRKNEIRIVLRRKLAESVVEVKRVSDRLMAMKLEIKGSILNIVSGYAPQVNKSMEEINDFW